LFFPAALYVVLYVSTFEAIVERHSKTNNERSKLWDYSIRFSAQSVEKAMHLLKRIS
jgi:hypothetical protein